MAKASIAPQSKAPTLGREQTVAAHLAILDDLQGTSSATEMESGAVAKALGVTGEEIRSSLLIANNVHLVSRQLEGLGT